jgi:hypothetical protein
MRAFLSHSSADKGFVEAVAAQLKPGTYELDSRTFEAGQLNAAAISDALSRSSLFCLFLSENSVNSDFVTFETLIAGELFAAGYLKKFVMICIDNVSFEKASKEVKRFNILRKVNNPDSAARIILGALINVRTSERTDHPFLGRESELSSLEDQLIDPDRPPLKAIFLSGNTGVGRRTIAQKFFSNQFPEVSRAFPRVIVDQFDGVEELHRKFLAAIRPSISMAELLPIVEEFTKSSRPEKSVAVAALISPLVGERQAVLAYDAGGLLTDAGGLNPDLDDIINLLPAHSHPPLILITNRMSPMRVRRPLGDTAYVAVRPLSREDTEKLILRLAKAKSLPIGPAQIDALINLSDNHPYNIYRMFEEIGTRKLDPFIANPGDFIRWKHRQSSEYIESIALSSTEIEILSALKLVPELDFEALSQGLQVDEAELSSGLESLGYSHVIDTGLDTFLISPPLRMAVERDARVRLGSEREKSLLARLADSLTIRIEDGTAPASLINSAVLASLETGSAVTGLASALVLPSHHVWLAKRQYDAKHWSECIRLAREALKGGSRLSVSGFIAASRYLCLAAARLGDQETFASGITNLARSANDNWTRSNVEFLQGFNARLKGRLPEAETHFREAHALSNGNHSATRELAAVCLMRNELGEAEKFAREAFGQASKNSYVLDILLSILVRKHGRGSREVPEIQDLFDILEQVGDEGGKSFYTTRRAEYEYLWGDLNEAARLIKEAIKRTPSIFEARRIYAEILIKQGNKSKALEEINAMRERVNARDPNERRTNYRPYLETYARYLTSVENYEDAKKVYEDRDFFTAQEAQRGIREIETVQSYKQHRK